MQRDGVAPACRGIGERDVEHAVDDEAVRHRSSRYRARRRRRQRRGSAPRRARRGRRRRRRVTPTRRSTTPPQARSARGRHGEAAAPHDRHLGERDREPAFGAVVHRRRRGASATRSRTRPCSRARRVEIGRRGRPVDEPVHHRGPLGPAELDRGRAEHDDVVAGDEPRPAGARPSSVVDQPDHAHDRRRVDVASLATRCRSSRSRR